MIDEEFKKIRHRFWRLGKERRFEVIKKMGFMTIEPFSGIDPTTRTEKNPDGNPYDPTAERIQREMLFYAKLNAGEDLLVTLIEEQEALITAEEESASYLKEPRPTEFPPSKEEMEAMKYRPGEKKEV